jgi:hypothetical protein
VTNDLNSLKQELLDYLVAEEFAVFRGQPGGLEGIEMIFWDTVSQPNYQAYLNVAKIAGARIIVFAHREFQADELDEAIEQLKDCEFGREELRSMERTLADLRAFVGSTCSVEMAFDYEGRLYVYETSTDWFQTFIDLSDLLMAASSPNAEEDDEDESDGSFGGYYSKN